MVTDSLDFEGGVQFVTLVNYLQYPCVIMFFNGNHGSHFSSIFSFTRRCEVVYISPTVTISTGDAQDILGEKSTDSYSFMPLVFYLQRSYSFNCDRFSEVQIRIEKDIAWLWCLIFFRFNFATPVQDSIWLLHITIPRYVVGSRIQIQRKLILHTHNSEEFYGIEISSSHLHFFQFYFWAH
jgi:hypothetical protein